MKLGDIKIEAIKLMFVNYSFDMGIADLQTMMSDENYGSYIVNINGSISRALDRIQNACVLPIKSKAIKEDELEEGKFSNRFDTTEIKDLYLIDRIVAEDDLNGYDGNAEYSMEGESLVLQKGREYRVLYYPKLKTIDDSVGDMDDIWFPDYIARLIPLFIKSDLYQEEEPNAAQEARNLFEASLEDLKMNTANKQNRVKRVYGY